MTDDTTPRLAPEIIWRLMDNNAVVVSPTGGKVRVLNDVGTTIWKMLAEEQSQHLIHDYLVAHYDVSPEQAQQDLAHFLADLTERGLLVW